MTGKRRKGRDEPRRPLVPPVHGPATGQVPIAGHVPSSRPEPPSPVTVMRQPTRRELRQERQRQRRRRLGAAGVAAVLVGVVLLALLVTIGVRKATHHDNKPSRTQATLLLQLASADRSAAASAVLAHDPATGQGVEVLLPSRLISDVCGFGSQIFGKVLSLPSGERVSRSAISGVMGVTVDGSWVLDATAFARLVNSVGPLTVDVDTDVVQGRTIVVPRGRQQLDGARAFAYATYSAPGEDATVELARLQTVLDALTAALPHKATDLARLVRGLGGGSSLSVTPDWLANLLVGFADDARSNDVSYQTLPVVAIDTGAGPASYRIDAPKLKTLVDSQLAASVPAASRSSNNRVYVENGVGTPGLAEAACDRLVRSGFTFAGSGNASSFGYATSQVLVFNRSTEATALGGRVARALGLPASDVQFSTRGQDVADVLVILGRDFRR